MSNAVTTIKPANSHSSVSNFLASTRHAVEDGISDARATIEQAWPKVTGTIGKGVYGLAYGVAFGVTFPVVLVAKVLPHNNCIGWGLMDGAHAANSAVDRYTK